MRNYFVALRSVWVLRDSQCFAMGLVICHPPAKVPAEAIAVTVEAVAAFGLFALPFKTIIGRMNGLLEDPDKKKKDGAYKLLVEIVKWMGPPSLGFAINRLDDKQKAALTKATKDSHPNGMTPTKVLRSPLPPPDPPLVRDDDGNVVIDLVEPVNLIEALAKTEYKAKIGSPKWQDRIAALDMVVTCCGSPPKLVPADHDSLVDKIKELVEDKMVAVAVAATKTIGVVADGLGPEFKPYGKPTASLLLGRFKEKKLVDLGLVALNNFYGHALSIDQIFTQVRCCFGLFTTERSGGLGFPALAHALHFHPLPHSCGRPAYVARVLLPSPPPPHSTSSGGGDHLPEEGGAEGAAARPNRRAQFRQRCRDQAPVPDEPG